MKPNWNAGMFILKNSTSKKSTTLLYKRRSIKFPMAPPKINANAGRDHWTRVSCAYLAGGGMRTGQAIGATNRLGEEPAERPVHMQEVVATIYHNLGIDTSSTTIIDPTGRPQYLVDHAPIAELI